MPRVAVSPVPPASISADKQAAYTAERTLNNRLLHDSTVPGDAPRLIGDHHGFLRNAAEEMKPAVNSVPTVQGGG